ncbi:MAG: radical SAM protein [Candidatus Woesearchaeota archaeon]
MAKNRSNQKFKKISIVLGYTCNNNCSFCCISKKRNKITDRKTKEVLIDIKKAHDEGFNYIEFIGGEPTIRKDFLLLIRYAKKLNFLVIAFATNGRMLSNKKYAYEIISSGANHIIFSIHGHNSKLHDNLTNSPGSFKQAIKGIKNLQNLAFTNIGTNTTIVFQNYKYLLDIAKLIYNLGIRCSEFIYVDPSSIDNKLEIIPSYEEVSLNVNQVLSFGKNKNISHWYIRYYPLCFIDKKYHKMVSEIIEANNFKSKISAPDFVNNDVIYGRKTIGKVKIPKCINCIYYSICEGYWKDYPYFDIDFKNLSKLNHNDNFYLDKLYFLLGLKAVVRLDLKSSISPLESYFSVSDNNYVYISREKNDANKALNLTYMESKGRNIKKCQEDLGKLYGYPMCCSSYFFKNPNRNKNEVMSQHFRYKGNKYSVLHYPCSKSCKYTKSLKEQIKSRLDLYLSKN